jgi:hypothetical protein
MFKALACDFDGTLASDDRIGPAALGALAKAREARIKLILVTGRTFFELTRVCECLRPVRRRGGGEPRETTHVRHLRKYADSPVPFW